MTPLRQRLLEGLQLRDFSPRTLEAYVGHVARDSQRAKSHGEKLRAQLQSRGHVIGPSGFILRVQAKIASTAEALRFGTGKEKRNVFIPQVNYLWQLVDSQGRVAWSAQATGDFLRERSKYYKTRKLSNSNTVIEDLYDFKGKPVEAAIAEEILEQGAGLMIPDELPKDLLLGNGQYVILPASLPWSFATNDNPK